MSQKNGHTHKKEKEKTNDKRNIFINLSNSAPEANDHAENCQLACASGFETLHSSRRPPLQGHSTHPPGWRRTLRTPPCSQSLLQSSNSYEIHMKSFNLKLESLELASNIFKSAELFGCQGLMRVRLWLRFFWKLEQLDPHQQGQAK